MNFFNLSADPYSLSQAMQGQPTYQQQVSRQAGQIVSAIGSKLPSVAGQVAQRVGQAVTGVGTAQPTPRYGPVTQLRTPSGQYHTYQGVSFEKGGLIGGSAGSIAPWYRSQVNARVFEQTPYRKEKGGMIKKRKGKKKM